MLDRMVCPCRGLAGVRLTVAVRISAKELTSLILDEERLRAERADRKSWKSRVTGLEEFGPQMGGSSSRHDGTPTRPRDRERRNRNGNRDDEDLEYKLALEASKNEAEEEKKRRERNANVSGDDDDLAKAIKLSKEEEELRRRELEETNSSALFDDTPAQPQPTGFNQGYQQQGAVDWFGNPVDQQQSQNTGFLNNAYSQPTGMQNQQTGFQNAPGYGYQQQPQQTGYDQFAQQNFMQPQQTSFNMNNPYGQQMNGGNFGQQTGFAQQTGFGQQQQMQSPIEQQNTLQPGSHNPWAQNQQQESLLPQPTGSNNPFASAINKPQAQPKQSIPTLGSLQELQEQKTQTQFNNQNFNPPLSFGAPQQAQPQKEATPQNPHHAQLNALLASGDGQDTFGNTGNLRIPAQHTAPGTFVNSAGAGLNRLNANQTGNNPFLNTQFTGMPQQTGFAQQNRMMPAQTGPASGFGGNNPFGRAPNQQQQGGGSLIDL